MDNFQMDGNEALNDALDIIALKEKEISMLKIQLAALMRHIEREKNAEADLADTSEVKNK